MTRHTGSMVVTRVAKIKLKKVPKSVASPVESLPPEVPEPVSSSSEAASPSAADNSTSRKHSTWHTTLEWLRSHLYGPRSAHWVALLLIGTACWGIIYSVTNGTFIPGGQLFSLLTLFVTAYLVGHVATLLRLPALLGMLITGIVMRNLGFIHVSGEYVEVTATLREAALCIILTRAGLGLDPTALRSLSLMVIRLAAIPSVVEGALITLVTHYVLGLPWIWGALLGSVLAAVSPAVVIPCLFALAEKGYGVDKGIPTLVVAAASFDDILAISVFGVILGIVFSEGDLTTTIIAGPLGVIIGIVFGIFWGILAIKIPHKEDSSVVLLRSLMIGCGGLVSILGSAQLGFQGAGPLGCIVLAFVACLGWRRQGWSDKNNPVADVFAVVWTVFQPVLFGLIGSEVDLSVLSGSIVGYGVLSLLIALFGRIVISIFIAFGAGFNWKEKIFVAWAWFPKATVQAAIGPVALDIAREKGDKEQIQYATTVLIVAVLAILITAPIGAILVTVLGPRLLTKTTPITQNQNASRGDTEIQQNDSIH